MLMKRLNINITDDLEQDIKTVMSHYGISKKTEAVRRVFREMVGRLERESGSSGFSHLLGAALKASPNHTPRFKGEDDLWS